ncbi:MULTISPECIES: sigma-54-dependent transcriptional regulator [Pelosinus]|uniref:Sigma-54 factor interaction domain-containing protein n=1 Tax=Pelosinus fermentans B4 TaxID=1149862 RepID=I8RA49_9FIRM|nr:MULTISPECIES: sigma-54 dependent transcriptional regulator [Pelosinus]EIW15733.1 sigma-54 factor interaction domain-containing protein [Pelosinus fermentans B4]EIW27561.1 two component, sigma54 specific, transcriptional regulator, Fis family [Pelosinus fermentans A11]
MNILLVDYATDSRAGIAGFLREMGHHVTERGDVDEAYATYTTGNFSMVLTDIRMPAKLGEDLLHRITALPGEKADVVLFTNYDDRGSAVNILREGAYDYLLKPVNVIELAAITDRIAEHHSLLRENKVLTERFGEEVQAATAETQREVARLKKVLAQTAGLDTIGFFSAEMNQIMRLAKIFHEDRSIPVLIQGETGTGKEIMSRMIHYGDMATQEPFIDLNCAALTASLFESELFGYEPGSFTGGLTKGQKGKLDVAQGGTLLLDEVGEIPLELQGKLLRVIQEKEFYRVGGLKKVKTDVRIICATNADLEQRVEEGTFRRDLFFRLKVGHLVIPPLRERTDDIIPLAQMFLSHFAKEKGKRFLRISPSAVELLLAYEWPGNVRELRNAMELAVLMYDDVELKAMHVNLNMQQKAASSLVTVAMSSAPQPIDPNLFFLPAAGIDLEEFIDRIVHQSLEMCHGNKTEAAKHLGISRRSFYCRLERKKAAKKPLQLQTDSVNAVVPIA